MLRIASLVITFLAACPAHAESIALNKTIYGAGETGTYSVDLLPNKHYYVQFRHRFTWDESRDRGTSIYSDTRELSITKEFTVQSHDRAAYDVVLLRSSAGAATEVARTMFYVLGEKPNPISNNLYWSHNSADAVTALEGEIGINVPAELKAFRPPRLDLVRLGRVMPGGAVEPDQLLLSRSLEKSPPHNLRLERDYTTQSILRAGNRVTVSHNTLQTLNQTFGQALGEARNIRQPESRILITGDVLNNRRHDDYAPLSTLPVGDYAFRVIGAHDRVLAEHRLRRFPPMQNSAIRFAPTLDDSPLTQIPAIHVALGELKPNEAHVSLTLLTRNGKESHVAGSDLQQLRPAVNGYQLNVPNILRTGRYRVSLYFALGRGQPRPQMILLDRQEFEYQQPAKQRILYPEPIAPPLEVAEVNIQLEHSQVPILGADLALSVLDTDNKPLTTGPLVAETYQRGHFTYDCIWVAGSYTGAAGLIDSEGRAQIAAPAVAGTYEVRLFRPMNETPVAGFSGADTVRVSRPHPGSVAHPSNMELVGIKQFDAIAPAAPQILQVAAPQLGKSATATVQDPGANFAGHQLKVSLWRSSGVAVDGKAILPSRRYAEPITAFPHTFTAPAIKEAGDYEFRVFDRTTGLYLARSQFSLRDAGAPLPVRAQFARNPSSDNWPIAGDRLRGIDAWLKPHAECAEPIFDEPPELSIVQLWVNNVQDPADDEYRVVNRLWHGRPYFVEARFEETPPEEMYTVRLDGKRKIPLYRTVQKSNLYRSRVVTFAQETEDEH